MIEADAPLLAKFYTWEKHEMWTYLTEHCEVGVPIGSEVKGWPCDGLFETSGATIVCPDKTIFADNQGVIPVDEVRALLNGVV